MIGRHLYDESAFDASRPVASWWEAASVPLAVDCPALEGRSSCEIAVIGAGFTGLAAALRLAGAHGADVRVLEAGMPGWGASGRNGGFCCLGGVKLDFRTMVSRYGLAEARRLLATERAAIDTVEALVEEHALEVDACARGETMLAHRGAALAALRELRRDLAVGLGLDCRLLDRDALTARGFAGPEFHGGLRLPVGFGLNPLAYARGLAAAAVRAGAVIHGGSPVIEWSFGEGRHRLRTAAGELAARRVLVATNGYTAEDLSPALAERLLPALSGVLVTRPLDPEELAAQGWSTTELAFDSRNLLHYFRLLPGNRFLFGGRGGASASARSAGIWQGRLRADFDRMFPAWREVEDTHFWRGFVCLARSRVPFVGALDAARQLWAGLAWHGNGVAMGTWAGTALAALVAGERGAEDAIPAALRAPLRPFPLPRLRVGALRAAYVALTLRDAGVPVPVP